MESAPDPTLVKHANEAIERVQSPLGRQRLIDHFEDIGIRNNADAAAAAAAETRVGLTRPPEENLHPDS